MLVMSSSCNSFSRCCRRVHFKICIVLFVFPTSVLSVKICRSEKRQGCLQSADQTPGTTSPGVSEQNTKWGMYVYLFSLFCGNKTIEREELPQQFMVVWEQKNCVPHYTTLIMTKTKYNSVPVTVLAVLVPLDYIVCWVVVCCWWWTVERSVPLFLAPVSWASEDGQVQVHLMPICFQNRQTGFMHWVIL